MHHKHVFLSNEDSPEGAACWVRDILTDGTLAYNACDYGTVIGVLDLNTGEYTQEEKDYEPVIDKIEKLEDYANGLFGKELVEILKQKLDYYLKNNLL